VVDVDQECPDTGLQLTRDWIGLVGEVPAGLICRRERVVCAGKDHLVQRTRAQFGRSIAGRPPVAGNPPPHAEHSQTIKATCDVAASMRRRPREDLASASSPPSFGARLWLTSIYAPLPARLTRRKRPAATTRNRRRHPTVRPRSVLAAEASDSEIRGRLETGCRSAVRSHWAARASTASGAGRKRWAYAQVRRT
jgi:hypothetical protein